MPRPRRSTRASGATTKYTNDPFELAGVSDESDPEDNPNRKGKAAMPDDGSSDEEFNAPNDEEEEDDDDDEDVEMAADDDDDEKEPASEEDDEAATATATATPRRNATGPKSLKRRHADGTIAVKDNDTHYRGIWNPLDHSGKMVHLQMTFGSDDKCLLSVVYVRDRWSKGLDSTFPTRSSLNAAQKAPDYKYGPTFGAEPEELERERTHGWDWYYADDIGERFRKRQRLELLEEKEAGQVYLPRSKEKKHTVFIGPTDKQTKFTLGQHESVNYAEAWRSETKGAATREGWILNVGQKVQCMSWAPNQPGLTQYLAVVSPITEAQKEEYPDTFKENGAPAFRPSAPYPCALQLWSFKAKKEKTLTKSLDMGSAPKLRLGLCTSWGDLRRIAWCPIARDPRDEDEEDALKNVGLLAGIWSDGFVRVIDVKMSRDPNKTEFYKVHSPVFEARPASTMCTCVAWLSPTDIAVGCANGFVAIWSILPSQDPSSPPPPYFYEPIHSTFILNISSAYPTHPHLLCTTSMDGETRLVSITDPHKDLVETNRMRMASPHLSYSPLLQSFLSSDENDFVRLLAVRRFFTTNAIARLPSTISAHAPSSAWHPSVLFGSTNGAVVATNPLRRLLHAKEKQWQQTWFTHEWVRGPETDSPGTSRFHDGYRAESISLLRNMMGDRRLINGVMVITIYEEGTHVTTLSWNPNQPYAGWASAGMGCGLIRVEDLALA